MLARWDKAARRKDYFPYISSEQLTELLNKKVEAHFENNSKRAEIHRQDSGK